MMDLSQLSYQGQGWAPEEPFEDWSKRVYSQMRENPVQEITLKPQWYDLHETVIDFIEKLLMGYLWEVKFGFSFIAHHDESREVERLLSKIAFLKRIGEDKDHWWPKEEEEYQLLMVDFARLVPSLWD